jgi:hypothetical protein
MTDSAELGTAREAAGVRSTAFYGDGKIPVPTASYSPPSAGGRSSPCRDRLPSCPARRRRGRSLPASRNRRGAGQLAVDAPVLQPGLSRAISSTSARTDAAVRGRPGPQRGLVLARVMADITHNQHLDPQPPPPDLPQGRQTGLP